MADATATAVRDLNIEADSNARQETLWGTITVAAGDYVSGGLPLSFLGIVPFHTPPVEVEVWSETLADGFVFRYLPAATPAIDTGTLAIFQGTATAVALAEVTGALASEITADTAIRWRGTWTKGR